MSTKVDSQTLLDLVGAVQEKFPNKSVTAVETENNEVVVSVFEGGVPVKLYLSALSLINPPPSPAFIKDVADAFHQSVTTHPIPQWASTAATYGYPTMAGTYGTLTASETSFWEPSMGSFIGSTLTKATPAPAKKPMPQTLFDVYGVDENGK